MNYLYNVNLYWVFEAKPVLQLMTPTFAYSLVIILKLYVLEEKDHKKIIIVIIIIMIMTEDGETLESRHTCPSSTGGRGLGRCPYQSQSHGVKNRSTTTYTFYGLSHGLICRNPSVSGVVRVKVFLCTNIVSGKGAINDITFMSGCVDITRCLPGANNAQIYRSNQTLVNAATL